MEIPVEEEPSERFCNWTFQRESELPEGVKLRMCTRCHGCWYVSREAQIEHWPIHRRVCCSVEDDWANLQEEAPHQDLFESFSSSFQNFMLALADPHRWIKCRLLLWAIQAIKRHLLNVRPDEMDQFLAANFLGIVPGSDPFEQCLDQGGQAIIDTIWAIPGWTNYFLSDEPFLSPILKFRKESGLPAVLPTDGRIADSPGYHLPAFYFQNLYQIYAKSETQMRPVVRTVPNHQRIAVFRRVMRTWSCEYCRTSIPSADGSRTEFFLKALGMSLQKGSRFRQYCYPHEIVPGLTAKQLFINIFFDDLFFPYLMKDDIHDTVYSILLAIHDNGVHFEDDEAHPWSHLSARDRIELLDRSHDWRLPNEDAGLCPALSITPDFFSNNVRDTVVHLITGTSTQSLLEMNDLCRSLSPPPSAETFHFVSTATEALMQQGISKVVLYNQILEPRVRHRGECKGLPEDLYALIASFALHRKYSFYSRRHGGSGLRFYTEAEEAIEQSRWEEQIHYHLREPGD